MILVDTSIWIDFFRDRQKATPLAELLESGEVVTHPLVLGELALGHLGPRRTKLLDDLRLLPCLEAVPFEEIFQFIEKERLAGSGLGWVDAELLYAALTERHNLWSGDRSLLKAARRYRCSYL